MSAETTAPPFEIELGDVFKLGDHILACGDLERGDGLRLLEGYVPAPRLTYCDPPWNARIHTVFRRWAKEAGARHRDPDLRRLFSRLQVICRRSELFVLEIGRERRDELLRMTANKDCRVGAVEITYSQGEAAAIVGVDRESTAGQRFDGLRSAVVHGDSRYLPGEVIRQFTVAQDWVCDPCLGLGLTLRAAHAEGRRCVGMELNPDRLRRAAASIRIGMPEKIGSLKSERNG